MKYINSQVLKNWFSTILIIYDKSKEEWQIKKNPEKVNLHTVLVISKLKRLQLKANRVCTK